MADVHPGQYLNEGTRLTTLQGVDAGAHVDFAVAQAVVQLYKALGGGWAPDGAGASLP